MSKTKTRIKLNTKAATGKTTSLLQEFKDFISRGNIVEIAVGLTVGTAFTTLIKSFVDSILMPVIALVLSGEALAEMYVVLDGNSYESIEAAKEAQAPVILYGEFLGRLIDFLIISIVIFFIVKALVKFKSKKKDKSE